MRVRQLLHLARRRTCWLSSERGPLSSCSGLWGSREETSAARYIPFLKLSCACLQLVVLNKIVLCQKRQELGKDVAFFTPQLPFDGEYLFYETLCQTFFYPWWYH